MKIDGRTYLMEVIDDEPGQADVATAELREHDANKPTCCGQPMRRSGMGGDAWICSKCEVYQGPLGARTPAEWWRHDGDRPAWRWALGQGYSTLNVSPDHEPGQAVAARACTLPVHRDQIHVNPLPPMTPEQADAIIAGFERAHAAGAFTAPAPAGYRFENLGPRPTLRADQPVPTTCRYCSVAVAPADLTEYTLQIWDRTDSADGVERIKKIYACSAESCMALAEETVGLARMNLERRRKLAAKQLAVSTSSVPVGVMRNESSPAIRSQAWVTATYQPEIGAKAPTPEQLPAIRARLDEIRRSPHQPIMLDADPPLPRPDGFAQSQVDAAKAALLAHVPRKGTK